MIPTTHRGWRKHFQKCGAVVDRAKSLGLVHGEIVSVLLDIDIAFQKYHMDLIAWLEADNVNFIHDFVGIRNNVNRVTKTIDGHFIPRFATFPPDDD